MNDGVESRNGESGGEGGGSVEQREPVTAPQRTRRGRLVRAPTRLDQSVPRVASDRVARSRICSRVETLRFEVGGRSSSA